MNTREALLELIGADFPDAGNTGIIYGSRRPGRDRDILVVQNHTPPVPTVVLGRLDLLIFQREYFASALSFFDPVAVEPVLTGELLFGDQRVLDEWRTQVRTGRPGKESVKYLAARALAELAASRQIFDSHDGEGEHLNWSFQNLSFSIAYASFATRYSKNVSTCCTLADLVRDGDVYLPRFWRYRDQIKAGARLDRSAVEQWLDEWSRSLIIRSAQIDTLDC